MSQLDRTHVEKRFDAHSRGADRVLKLEDFYEVVTVLGLGITKGDTRVIFEYYDKAKDGEVTYEPIVNHAYSGKFNSYDVLNSTLTRVDLPDTPNMILCRQLKETITDSIYKYLKLNPDACLGHLLLSHIDTKATTLAAFSGVNQNTATLTRKQLRKVLMSLGCQLSDVDESTVFEALSIRQDGRMNLHDFLLYFMDLTLRNDNMKASCALKKVLEKKTTAPKELIKLLHKAATSEYRLQSKGLININAFEGILAQLYGCESSVTKVDEIEDLLLFFDPTKMGRVDIEYIAALAGSCVDTSRATAKLKYLLKLLQTKGVNCPAVLNEVLAESINKDGVLPCDELASAIVNHFSIPMLPSEVLLIAARYQKRNKINIESFLEKVHSHSVDTDGSNENNYFSFLHNSTHHHSDNFGKKMTKKILKLRSNIDKRDSFRVALLKLDTEMSGTIPQRDLQRLLDSNEYIDFKDTESSLLIENLRLCEDKLTNCATTDQSKDQLDQPKSSMDVQSNTDTNNIPYSMLLLILHEPMTNQSRVTLAGNAVIKHILREGVSDIDNMIASLRQKCREADTNHTGLIQLTLAQSFLAENCKSIDHSNLLSLLQGLKHTKSDSVYHPELCIFLRCCSISSVMIRLHRLDITRHKQQGLNLQAFLSKHAQKRSGVMDQVKLNDILTHMGILVAETELWTIFTAFGSKSDKSILDIDRFITCLKEGGNIGIQNLNSDFVLEALPEFPAHDDGTKEIIQAYDSLLLAALQEIFDSFDGSHTNEIATNEIERVLQSLGFELSMTELIELYTAVDPYNKGTIEYRAFISHTMSVLRTKYHEVTYDSIDQLKRWFMSVDHDKDGTLNHSEFHYFISIVTARNKSCLLMELTDEEINALTRYIDIDDEEIIIWSEFAQIFEFMLNENSIVTLPVLIQKAIRKVKYFQYTHDFHHYLLL